MFRYILSVCLGLVLVGPFGFRDGDFEPIAPVFAATPAVRPDTEPKTADTVVPSQEAPAMLRVVATDVVGQLTGRNSPNDTAANWGIHGTDLGHMFRHRDQLYMVFGDTFGEPGFGGKNWRSNVMARIADPDPRQGLRFEAMITSRDGLAKELIPSLKVGGVEKTVIPTYGISVANRMYLHYMSVRRWGTQGDWKVRHSGLAYSDDDGQNWATPKSAVWPGGTGFEQVAFVLQDSTLYTFGIPEGRHGSVRLRRVAQDRILVREAYEYWNGTEWLTDAAAAAAVVPAPAGELSVAWSAAHGLWLMMYLDLQQYAVVLRTAPTLVGPWSESQVVAAGKTFPGLYAPYIVPGSEIGGELYYTMSLWEPYNVFLMRSALEPVDPSVPSAEAEGTLQKASGTPITRQD